MELPRLKSWEVWVVLPTLILVAILGWQRHLIYSKGNYGLLSGDSLVLFLWGLIGLLLLLATKPWSKVSTRGSTLRWMGVVLALGCVLFMLTVTSGWGRTHWLKLEALSLDLGITHPYQKGLKNLALDVGEPDVGPYLLGDRQLRRFMMEKTGHYFLTQPTQAGQIFEHEAKSGPNALSFEDLRAFEHGDEFLLACLVSQVGTHHGGLWGDDESKKLIDHFLEDRENQNRDVLENLVYVLMNAPELFNESQREQVLKTWTGQFVDLQPLAVEGLMTRREVKKFIVERGQPLRTKVEVVGARPGDYYYRQLDLLLTQSALGLIRSCGLTVEEVTERPELLIRVRVAEIAHHEYLKPTYDYETYYVDQTYSLGKPYNTRTRRVRKQRMVQTGSENMVAYAPTATVTLSQDSRTLELPEVLIFWHHLRYDDQKKRYLDLDNEKTFGRMWPFGISKRKMEFPFSDD